jgi:hypothetical protein
LDACYRGIMGASKLYAMVGINDLLGYIYSFGLLALRDEYAAISIYYILKVY